METRRDEQGQEHQERKRDFLLEFDTSSFVQPGWQRIVCTTKKNGVATPM